MEFRIPKKGDIYRHFKGNLYEVIIIARDSETLEEKVVYKEVNGDAAYVRSLSMFVSLVDKEKYPNTEQEFRFEFVGKAAEEKREVVEEKEEKFESSAMIMEFLDLDSVSEKIRFLQKSKDKVSENFLEVVAQSLDFVENGGSITERYDEILRYLRTVERYEKDRFR